MPPGSVQHVPVFCAIRPPDRRYKGCPRHVLRRRAWTFVFVPPLHRVTESMVYPTSVMNIAAWPCSKRPTPWLCFIASHRPPIFLGLRRRPTDAFGRLSFLRIFDFKFKNVSEELTEPRRAVWFSADTGTYVDNLLLEHAVLPGFQWGRHKTAKMNEMCSAASLVISLGNPLFPDALSAVPITRAPSIRFAAPLFSC